MSALLDGAKTRVREEAFVEKEERPRYESIKGWKEGVVTRRPLGELCR